MVFYVSAQLSLLTCSFITFSSASNYDRQSGQFQTRRTHDTSDCTYSDYVYDPTVDACVQEHNRVNCGENMAFKTTGSLGKCSCVCRSELDLYDWVPPQILSRNGSACCNLGERGPCQQGHALVPIGGDVVMCGVDACANKEPRNAVHPYLWSQPDPNEETIFKFTYKGECYLSETEAFCGKDQVLHFYGQSKSPTCVSTSEHIRPEGIDLSVKVPCKEGYTEDRARNLCVPSVRFDR